MTDQIIEAFCRQICRRPQPFVWIEYQHGGLQPLSLSVVPLSSLPASSLNHVVPILPPPDPPPALTLNHLVPLLSTPDLLLSTPALTLNH